MASYKKYIRRNHKPFVSAVGDLNRSDSINQVKAETDKSGVTVCVKEEPFVSDEYDLQPVKPDIVGIDAIRSITAESSTDTSRYGCNYSTDVKVKTEELSFIKNEPGASNNNESIETTTIKIEDDGLLYCEHNYTKEQQGKSSSGNIERPFKEDEEAGPSTSCELKTEVDLDAVKMDEEGITGSESTEEDSESDGQETSLNEKPFAGDSFSYTVESRLTSQQFYMTYRGSNIKQYACDSCTFKTHTEARINEHIRAHANLYCEQCDELFETRHALDHHLQNEHLHQLDTSSYKVYKCSECSYSSSEKSSFDEHIVTKHSDKSELIRKVTNDTYECPHCEYKTTIKETLDTHMLIHSESLLYVYKCYKCDFVTSLKSRYKIHLSTHKTKNSYYCSACKTVFRTRFRFYSHIVDKHGENDELMKEVTYTVHKCEQCQYKTFDICNIARHMLVHSKGTACPKKPHHTKRSKIRENSTPHTCSFCHRSFPRLQNLKVHVTTQHSDNSERLKYVTSRSLKAQNASNVTYVVTEHVKKIVN